MGVQTHRKNSKTKHKDIVSSTTNNTQISKTYTFTRKAGKSIIERCPVFSPDGESLAVIVENVVRVYNVQTGECARTLETETAIKNLVSIVFPDEEDYNLYGCSDDGLVVAWTWESGVVLRETKLKTQEFEQVVTFNMVNKDECFITSVGSYEFLNLGTYSAKTGDLIVYYRYLQIEYHPNMLRVAIGTQDGEKYAAISNGTKCVFVQSIHKAHRNRFHINYSNLRVLSVATAKDGNDLAITDAIGRVIILRGNLFENNLARESLHWHFLPAFACCFSSTGNYLFSGGTEKVLVKWSLGTLSVKKAQEKEFIPRLPGLIRFIAASNNYAALTLSNNSIVIANAQMRVVTTILECGGLSPYARSAGTSLVYHRPMGALLMGGRVGHLQLYSTATDKVLYNIDITEMNPLPPEDHNLIPVDNEVACAAVSAGGAWLATSEYRNDGYMFTEERLKFWAINTNTASPFKLNTCVNLSHGGCRVVSIAFDAKGDICVTSGEDEKLRIWKKVRSQNNKRAYSWICLTACYYSSGTQQYLADPDLNKFKFDRSKIKSRPYLYKSGQNDMVQKVFDIHKENSIYALGVQRKYGADGLMGEVAISQDGSLFAAWFGSKITLWDTYLCNLRTTLSHPALRPENYVPKIVFGHEDAAHYLVCATQQCIAVWNLLSLTIKWIINTTPVCLVADPFSNRMALVTTNNDLYIFTPHESTPILERKGLLDPQTGVFKQCTFASTSDEIRLYLMRNDSEIYCLEEKGSDKGNLEVISRRTLPTSNFSALMAEKQSSEVKSRMQGELHFTNKEALRNSALAQFLSGAAHMLPPVSLLSTQFLQHLSGYKEVEDEEVDDEMDVDEASSDDDDVKLNGPYAPKAVELWTPNYQQVKQKRLNKILRDPLLDTDTSVTVFGVN